MFHSSTELLIDYWRERRGARRLPSRADIDPTGFAALAARAFIAQREPAGDVRFRLAGETVMEWHGRRLAGESLLRLWWPEHRFRLASVLRRALVGTRPVVISAFAERARLEVLFAPLTSANGAADRFLGLYQPVFGTNVSALGELRIDQVREVGLGAPLLRLAAVDGRRIA